MTALNRLVFLHYHGQLATKLLHTDVDRLCAYMLKGGGKSPGS